MQQHGFEQVELVYTLGEKAYRSDMSAPAILNVIEIAKAFSPNGVSVLPTTAGTGPMHQFFEALEVPIASFGKCRVHHTRCSVIYWMLQARLPCPLYL